MNPLVKQCLRYLWDAVYYDISIMNGGFDMISLIHMLKSSNS
jgi:hypothetical protein